MLGIRKIYALIMEVIMKYRNPIGYQVHQRHQLGNCKYCMTASGVKKMHDMITRTVKKFAADWAKRRSTKND